MSESHPELIHLETRSNSPLAKVGVTTLSLDLSHYLSAITHLPATVDPGQSKDIADLKQKIIDMILGGPVPESLCQEMLSNALAQIPGLDDAEILKAMNSTAVKIMTRNFRELAKNAIDAIIIQNLTHPEISSPLLILNLDIDLSTPEQIKISLRDNGPGFPAELLTRLQTKDGIIDYCEHAHVSERTTKRDVTRRSMSPYLFGGMGRGLQIFLMQASSGENIRETKKEKAYNPESLLNLRISNSSEGGAVLELTTDLSPALVQVSSKAPSPPLLRVGIFSPPRSDESHQTHSDDKTATPDDETPTIKLSGRTSLLERRKNKPK